MSKFERRLTLAVGAVVTVVVSAAIALFGGGLLASVLEHMFPAGAPGTNVQGGELGALYYLSFFLFSAAAGLSFFYLAWNRNDRSWRRNILYGLGTLILLLISGANFVNNDNLIPRVLQAGLNIFLIFISLVLVLDLFSLELESMEGRVFRALSACILIGVGVALPALFNVIWFLDRLKIDISLSSNKLSAIASMIGAITGVLTYMRKAKENSSR